MLSNLLPPTGTQGNTVGSINTSQFLSICKSEGSLTISLTNMQRGPSEAYIRSEYKKFHSFSGILQSIILVTRVRHWPLNRAR